jgi:low affinity Fe/Cu permease
LNWYLILQAVQEVYGFLWMAIGGIWTILIQSRNADPPRGTDPRARGGPLHPINDSRKDIPMAEKRADSNGGVSHWFQHFATRAAELVGTRWAFLVALSGIVVWAVTGPVFRFSDTWQLVINTGTTIVTFLMVFLIQRSQNKDALAIHLKLNEIVAALEGASNRLIDVEDLTEDEIKTLHAHYQKLIELAKTDTVLTATHSIEEATARHGAKYKSRKRLAENRI